MSTRDTSRKEIIERVSRRMVFIGRISPDHPNLSTFLNEWVDSLPQVSETFDRKGWSWTRFVRDVKREMRRL